MKYLVMECHPAYAIVLDEKGVFLEVANLNYKVGETLTKIYPSAEELKSEMKKEPLAFPNIHKKFKRAAIIAASFIIIFAGSFGIWKEHFKVYGTLSLSINPQVKISLSHSKRVRALEGINQDGKQLIDGMEAKGEKVEKFTDDLVQKALDMGFLQEGGKVNIAADSEDLNWTEQTEESVKEELKRFSHNIKIVINIDDSAENTQTEEKPVVEKNEKIIIPIQPDTGETQEKTSTPVRQINNHKPDDDNDFGDNFNDNDDYYESDYNDDNLDNDDNYDAEDNLDDNIDND